MQHDAEPAAMRRRQLRERRNFLGLLRVLGFQHLVAGDQVELLQRKRHGNAQIIVVPRLENEFIDRAFIDRAHHRVSVGMAGQHDADRLGRAQFHLMQKLGAVHAGHHEITDHQMHRPLCQLFERFLAAAGSDYLVVFLTKNPGQRLDDAQFIIHQQQTIFRRGQMRCRRLRCTCFSGKKAGVIGHIGIGKKTVTVVPTSGALASSMRPLWASTILRAVDKPSPAPAPTARVVKKGWNARSS